LNCAIKLLHPIESGTLAVYKSLRENVGHDRKIGAWSHGFHSLDVWGQVDIERTPRKAQIQPRWIPNTLEPFFLHPAHRLRQCLFAFFCRSDDPERDVKQNVATYCDRNAHQD